MENNVVAVWYVYVYRVINGQTYPTCLRRYRAPLLLREFPCGSFT